MGWVKAILIIWTILVLFVVFASRGPDEPADDGEDEHGKVLGIG